MSSEELSLDKLAAIYHAAVDLGVFQETPEGHAALGWTLPRGIIEQIALLRLEDEDERDEAALQEVQRVGLALQAAIHEATAPRE